MLRGGIPGFRRLPIPFQRLVKVFFDRRAEYLGIRTVSERILGGGIAQIRRFPVENPETRFRPDDAGGGKRIDAFGVFAEEIKRFGVVLVRRVLKRFQRLLPQIPCLRLVSFYPASPAVTLAEHVLGGRIFHVRRLSEA